MIKPRGIVNIFQIHHHHYYCNCYYYEHYIYFHFNYYYCQYYNNFVISRWNIVELLCFNENMHERKFSWGLWCCADELGGGGSDAPINLISLEIDHLLLEGERGVDDFGICISMPDARDTGDSCVRRRCGLAVDALPDL